MCTVVTKFHPDTVYSQLERWRVTWYSTPAFKSNFCMFCPRPCTFFFLWGLTKPLKSSLLVKKKKKKTASQTCLISLIVWKMVLKYSQAVILLPLMWWEWFEMALQTWKKSEADWRSWLGGVRLMTFKTDEWLKSRWLDSRRDRQQPLLGQRFCRMVHVPEKQ